VAGSVDEGAAGTTPAATGHAGAALRPAEEVPGEGVAALLRTLLRPGGARQDMLSGLRGLRERFGPVVAQGAGSLRMVNLFGPDANRFVLMDRERIFSSRRPWMRIMGHVFPNGLLLRDGEEHKHHRKIMHEAFKRPVLRSYGERMNPRVEAGLAGWAPRGGRVQAFSAFKGLTLDVAASIFVGQELGPRRQRMNERFEDLVAASMSRLRLPLPGLEYTRGVKARAAMLRDLDSLLADKRGRGGEDMFARLFRAETEEGERFADADILDHMNFLMVAAHDTTTSTLTSMTYELARQPELQERLREESRALGRSHAGLDDEGALPGLGLTLKETLRRYPPLPVIPRTATQDFDFGGYRFPAGTTVVVSPIHTHHMPEWWSDPFRFDPGRFAPGRAEDQRHTHSWVPFGGGPHMCLGKRFAEMQVRIVMHQMLLRYRWSVPDGYRMPVQQAPISKPRDGLPIDLEPV